MLLEDGIRRKKEKEGLGKVFFFFSFFELYRILELIVILAVSPLDKTGFVSPKRKYNEPASPTHTVSLSLFLNDDMTFKSDDLSQSFYPSSTSSKKRPRISSTSLPPQLSKHLDSDDEEDEGDDQEGFDVDQEEEEEEDEGKPDFQLSESLGGGVGGGGNGEEGDSEWVNVEE